MAPLAGLLVVDLSRYLPGAFATRELRRLGARVVRLEPPGGDPMRDAAPAWHDALNAGAESVVCDLKAEPELGRALAARADIVVESFRPGVVDRLGIGPADLPDSVVYCSITGFGTEGPHAQRAGHDLNYLGWAGVLADTAPGLPPVQVADLAAGALGAVTEILAALLARQRTGRGRRVVVSMTHGSHRLAAHRLGGDPLRRLLTGGLAAYGSMPTAGRSPADRRCARAEVLQPPLRSPRPPGARRSAVRRGRQERDRARARARVRGAVARRLARALRRRGRVRRPGGDARGGEWLVRPA